MALNLMNQSELLNTNPFKPARRTKTSIKLAIVGMPGTGKTFTALMLAKQWGLKTAVIDSERGSASLYADMFDFDVLTIEGDYHPTKYINAIKSAEAHSYEVLIIDSLSHPWSGEGGIRALVDKIKQGSRNQYAGWSEVNPFHYGLIDAIKESECHIIGTLRGKPLSDSNEVDPIFNNLGIDADQRGGFLYEFDAVGVMDAANVCHISKSRLDTIHNLDLVIPDSLTGKARPKGTSINYVQFANRLLEWADKGIDPEMLFFLDDTQVGEWVNKLYDKVNNRLSEDESKGDFAKRLLGYLNKAHNSGFDRFRFFAEVYNREDATRIVTEAIAAAKVAPQDDPAAVPDSELEAARGADESPFRSVATIGNGKVTDADPKDPRNQSGEPTIADESDGSDSAAGKA